MRACFSALLVLGAVLTGCGTKTPPPAATTTEELPLPPGAEAAAEQITEEDLLARVTALASDEMEGRGPGSEGDRRARRYLAQAMESLGLEPAFRGGAWEQPLTLVGVRSHVPETWEFLGSDGSVAAFRHDEEVVASAGRQQNAVIEDAPVVFVGYGINAPEQRWDDFKGTDLEGKVLLVLNDDPDWDEDLFAGERKLRYGRWDYKFESAAAQGAAAAIILHTTESAGYPWAVVQTGARGEEFELPAADQARLDVRAWITEAAARELVALSGHDLDELVASARSRDFAPLDLGVTTSLAVDADVRTTESANVGGILRGDDLVDEIVIYSAHHDHFGRGAPDATGDRIYNGALDNGVAMAQALATARAFAGLPGPPRRSVMFLFVAAEEQGLLGSQYFATSGAVDPGKVAANVNFELGNVWGRTHDVTVYGRGKSELEDLLRVAAAGQERVLTGETDVRAGWFYRSDQFSFARVGIPAIWFKSGTDFIGRPEGWGEARYAEWIAEKYHRPGDEVEPAWVFDGLAEDARLAFLVGAAVATRDEMPRWRPGDEFEAVRERSLAEVAEIAGRAR